MRILSIAKATNNLYNVSVFLLGAFNANVYGEAAIMKLKKITAAMLVALMAFNVASCGDSSKKSETAKTEETQKKDGTTDVEKTNSSGKLEDGMEVVNLNFDDGDTAGFTVYTKGGTCDITNPGDKLEVDIENCGYVDYGCQIYYDGFALNQGGVYSYSFDVSSDIERTIEWRIQINGGDYHAYAGDYITIGPETKTITAEFEMTEESDPAPRLVFNMGLQEDMDSDPGAHAVYFDNILLTVKDSSNAEVLEGLPEYPDVTVNQIGYQTTDIKTVIVKSREETTFSVINADTNESVYEGTFGDAVYDTGSNLGVQRGDFSEVTTPGTYYVSCSTGDTYTFVIADDAYADVYKDVVLMLYKQRCGTEVTEEIAGDFAHEACHTGLATVYGTDEQVDVTGGWHDAGDYGRYVVPGAKTIKDLFLTYEDCNATSDELGIPESGNGIPDILDEAKWELDWMLKMQTADGSVYHKVTCANFPETVPAVEETDELILAPVSFAATADFAAVMAEASVIYADYDSDFAAKCKEAAYNAWLYMDAQEKATGFKNPVDIVTGEYPDTTLNDEYLWAATELYLAGYTELEEDVRYWMDYNGKTGFGWQQIASYAYVDLALYGDEAISDVSEAAKTTFMESVDKMVEKSEKTGYYTGITSYPWGSNMTIINDGVALMLATKITGDDSYATLAQQKLDYVLGNNPLGYCFVTGYGTVSPVNPHHRPSQYLGQPMVGMLIGGADSNLEDPYAKAVLFDQAPAMCYVDNVQSYSCNEIAIYWNSPLIYMLAANQ